MSRTVYYEHCISIYHTPQELRDVQTLSQLGFSVMNPNNAITHAAVMSLKAAGGDYMSYFKPIVESADVFAFRALPDGHIPAGIAKTLYWAIEAGKPVIELPGYVGRVMSLDDTRQYLLEVGQR